MNILIDQLPTEVEVGGRMYEIRSDFRISILFELLIQDDEIQDKDKIWQALDLFYPVIPDDVSGAVEKMLWFFRCGKQNKNTRRGSFNNSDSGEQSTEEEQEARTRRPIYSFEHDAEYIYSAFLQQYGIDLQSVKYLHWWKFRALFKCLDEKTEFRKIMGYRGMKITSDMPKNEQQFYRKMQRLYAIPLTNKQMESQERLEKALMNGEDITDLLK